MAIKLESDHTVLFRTGRFEKLFQVKGLGTALSPVTGEYCPTRPYARFFNIPHPAESSSMSEVEMTPNRNSRSTSS